MDNNSRIQELKSKLNEELKKSVSDNDLIISLSQEIASLDSERVRFSVDAGLINRLGTELVGKKETAVSELVKNAYDADATLVKLIFENSNEEGGILQIEDNGSGMSRNELINGFMKISSTEKVRNPLSPKYNRNRAGRKGIGRFAVQRLAGELIILTKKRDTKQAYRLVIDWSKYTGDKDLLSISNSIEEVAEKAKIMAYKNKKSLENFLLKKYNITDIELEDY